MARNFHASGQHADSVALLLTEWNNFLRNPLHSKNFMVDQPAIYSEILRDLFNPDCRFLFHSLESLSNEVFNALLEFLAPQGPLFSLMEHLMSQNAKFCLPLAHVHATIRESIELGSVSTYTRRKIDFQTQSIHCDALEFFFFRYFDNAFCVSFANSSLNIQANIYSALFCAYLDYFLPKDKILTPLLLKEKIAGPNVSTHFTQNLTKRGATVGSPYGLVRREFLQNSINSVQSPECSANNESPTYSFLSKIHTLLQILSDCWLVKLHSSIDQDAFICHLLTVLLQHTYKFVYTHSDLANDQVLANFKQEVVQKLLAPNLANFFEISFNSWPLDSSFDLLSSLWLTFLQPWHFAKRPDSAWLQFINSHYRIYWKFFKITVARFLRSDLKSAKMSQCVLDVFSVFGKEPLLDSLQFDPRKVPCGFGYFDQEFVTLLTEFYRKINFALLECEKEVNSAQTSKMETGWTGSLVNFFSDIILDDAETKLVIFRSILLNYKKVVDILTQNFHVAVPVSNLVTSSHSSAALPIDTSTSFSLKQPDQVQGSDGRLKLTPKGRMQILNRLSNFNFDSMASKKITFATHPSFHDDFYSPSSGEIGLLVEFWNVIASTISARYSADLEKLFFLPGHMGRFCRIFLTPSAGAVPKSAPGRMDALKPRLSLRFLASYKFFVIYGLVAFLFWFLFGVSPALFISSTFLFTGLLLVSLLFF